MILITSSEFPISGRILLGTSRLMRNLAGTGLPMAASEDFPAPDSGAGTDISHAQRRADATIESLRSGMFGQDDVVAAKPSC